MWWRKRSSEEPSDRDDATVAGEALCMYAGLKYSRNTAKYLAEVIRQDRYWELTPETRAGLATALLVLGREALDALVSDILD